MFKYLSVILLFVLVLFSCNRKEKIQNKPVQIAFMADVHLQDVYGQFQDSDYSGVKNPKTGKFTLARTMKSQLQSTRLFNENYFAFLAALDDVASKGVKYVVLPGDFSDDGQALNIRGLKRILNTYTKKHNIKFITTTGNHDPVKPFYQEGGKHDFLGEGGKQQPIFSNKEIYISKDSNALKPVITKDIAKLGYKDILSELQDFGFYPKKTDRYWETPFTKYSYNNYSFKEALQQSELIHRNYTIPPFSSQVPDVSYLVEPSDNLWFLAIDANVYVPKDNAEVDSLNPKNYNSASLGYNNVLTHKKHLINWMKSVVERSKKLGKTLIVFSHYPTIDFNDDASELMSQLFGENSMQLHRVPHGNVSKMFIDAGVKVHFGGHMHINDTGVRIFDSGTLVNVQIPSLAAYIPAYKLLTIKEDNKFEIETIVIDSVANFKSIFPLYEQEYAYLKQNNDSAIWNKDILSVKTYKDYTRFHLKELVRLRFLNEDWSEDFKALLIKSTGKDLLNIGLNDEANLEIFSQALLKQNKSIESFSKWTGLDMINDFYKIKNADELAFFDINKNRLEEYKILCEQLRKSNHKDLKLWASIFMKMCHGAPSNHFEIDLKSSKIKLLTP